MMSAVQKRHLQGNGIKYFSGEWTHG